MNFNLKSIFFIFVAITLVTDKSFSQEADTQEIFGDWQITCDVEQKCRMSQTVIQTSTKRLMLQLKVFKSKTPTALLTFPLGILLNTGWQYQIDGKRQTVVPFEICNTDGCHAGIKLTPKLLSTLKRGNTLDIRFFDAAKNTVNPKISLSGFTKAYAKLK